MNVEDVMAVVNDYGRDCADHLNLPHVEARKRRESWLAARAAIIAYGDELAASCRLCGADMCCAACGWRPNSDGGQ